MTQKPKSIFSASLLAASLVVCTLAVAKPAEAMRTITGCIDTPRGSCSVYDADGGFLFSGHKVSIEIT